MGSAVESTLAVHEDSNSCAALFLDGRLEFAAAEERYTRVRFHAGRPLRTLEDLAQRYGLGVDTVSALVAANECSFLPSLPGSLLPQDEHDVFGLEHKLYLRFQDALTTSRLTRACAATLTRTLLRRRFSRLARIVDHHTAHAYSAYMTSGFEEATAITADGFGDGSSSKIFRCRAGRCEPLYGVSAVSSVGIFHAEMAQVLGIDARLGGKVTGMAAYGDPRRAYPFVAQLIGLNAGRRGFTLPPIGARQRQRSPYAELAQLPQRDVAAAVQQRLEEVFLPYVEQAVAESGIADVVLAGGVFGNVKLTQRIAALPSVGRVFVHPAMNDHGIAVGAGLEYLARERGVRPARLPNVYLGPGYSAEECAAALEQFGLRYREEADIDACVAELLAAGKVVARYADRLEYGPRALGNRSILYRSDDPSVNDWLNRMLRRREYMPFAPATVAEAADECYGDLSRVQECVRFMTIAVPCTEYMRRTSPGAVHIDGTARPQVVRQDEAPRFHRILHLYRERSGIPSLLNTSFNMHEEPIVCTPSDACRAFVSARLPYLALGPFLVVGADGEFPSR
jgi:carbamoyltransferase